MPEERGLTMVWSVDEWNRKPFMEWAGLRVVHARDGLAEVEVALQDHHRGGGGTRAVNGAIQAYVHDVIQGIAISTLFDSSVSRMATIHLNIEYPKLLVADKVAMAYAKAVRLGGSVAFCDSEFRDEHGEVCSKSSGSFVVKRRPPALALGTAPQ